MIVITQPNYEVGYILMDQNLTSQYKKIIKFKNSIYLLTI